MRFLLFLLFSCTVISCCGEEKVTPKVKGEKEMVYGLSVQIDMPFELYVNDIAVAKEYSKARKIMGIELNPYLLKNGTYEVKLRLLPLEENGQMVVRPTDVATSFVKFIQFEIQRQPMMGRAKNYKIIKQLPLPQIENTVPILEASWEIEITELPYELEGWSNSHVTRKQKCRRIGNLKYTGIGN